MKDLTIEEKQIICGALRCYIDIEGLPEELLPLAKSTHEKFKNELKRIVR
jgi:hypothetical protein